MFYVWFCDAYGRQWACSMAFNTRNLLESVSISFSFFFFYLHVYVRSWPMLEYTFLWNDDESVCVCVPYSRTAVHTPLEYFNFFNCNFSLNFENIRLSRTNTIAQNDKLFLQPLPFSRVENLSHLALLQYLIYFFLSPSRVRYCQFVLCRERDVLNLTPSHDFSYRFLPPYIRSQHEKSLHSSLRSRCCALSTTTTTNHIHMRRHFVCVFAVQSSIHIFPRRASAYSSLPFRM